MTDKEFVPADWLAAGYTRFEANDMNSHAAFMVQKAIRDEDGSRKRYYITVGVYDYEKFKHQALTRWGFSPEVQFTREVTMNVSLHTSDPAIAEAEFHALWVSLGKPYYD